VPIDGMVNLSDRHRKGLDCQVPKWVRVPVTPGPRLYLGLDTRPSEKEDVSLTSGLQSQQAPNAVPLDGVVASNLIGRGRIQSACVRVSWLALAAPPLT
jgi:hypothetical protein